MLTNNKIVVSAIILSLCCGINGLDAAATKKKQSSSKAKKQTVKGSKPKNQVITPSEAFYDKTWEKFKVGNKNDREEVIKTLKKIIKDTPDEYMAYYYLGVMTNEEGQSNQALSYFEIALAGFPQSSDIHIRMAKILDEKNKTDEANIHYAKALEISPNNPDALSRLGIMELRNKNYSKAAEYLKKAQELQPDNSATLKALGEVWLEQGNYSGAIDILEQALLFDNSDANVHLMLGKAYETAGKHEKAVSHIEQAGKYGKKDTTIMNAIGYDIGRNLAESGRYEEALAAYKKEVKKNSNPALGYYEMGGVFESLEDQKNALKAYQKAYELDKKMIQGIFRCAEIYQENNDKENTEKMLKILKSNSQYKEKAKEMIEEIKTNEKEKAEQEIDEKINGSSNDADLEAALIAKYNSDKQNSAVAKSIYNYYKSRGYYDEAIKWYRKYAKVGSVTNYEKQSVERDLKDKLEQDNYLLFGKKSESKSNKSSVSDEELIEIARNGDNDRQKDLAFQILLSRKDTKGNKRLLEDAIKFYEKRGKVKEASKYINQMKKLGYLTDSEAKSRKERLKD